MIVILALCNHAGIKCAAHAGSSNTGTALDRGGSRGGGGL